jgi:hypothetical protein
MTKKIIVIAAFLIGFVGYSQENTSSPYSFYGLGEVKFKGTEDAKAMGGLSILADSINLNLSNPASYSSLNRVTFAVGSTTSFNTLKNSTTSEKAKRTSFDYLAIGIPMGKIGASFGLMPYSAVGYKVKNTFTDADNTSLERSKRYTGNGNINKAFIGGAYSINSDFSVGLDLQYNFGTLKNTVSESLIDNGTAIQLSTSEKNTSNINGLSVSAGLMYKRKINEKLDFYSSTTYSPESKLNSTNTRNTATVTYSSSGGTEYTNASNEDVVTETDLILPSRLSIGAGIGERNKWLIGSEVILQSNSNLVNRFTNSNTFSYKNSQTFILGGFYIPQFDAYSGYFKKVIYRAGLRYESTGLIVNNENINDFGMNFGLGLPVGLSKINIGLEFGKKGTTNSNLIQENYFNLSFGLSLSDKWFRKRKID